MNKHKMSLSSDVIVSSYYHVDNKYGKNRQESYFLWMRNLLPYIECHMIIFVESIELFQQCIRENNIILSRNIELIACPMSSFRMSSSKYDWRAHHDIDPEADIHTIELYKIWNEKLEFIHKAIEMTNQEGLLHQRYVWMDIGCVRDNRISPFLRFFPDANIRLANGQVYMMNIQSHPSLHLSSQNDILDVKHIRQHVGAPIIAGDVIGFKKLYKLFYTLLDTYFEQGIFAGKDQNLYFNLHLRHPNLLQLVNVCENHWLMPYQNNPWFYMINFLIAPKKFCLCDLSTIRGGLEPSILTLFSHYTYSQQTDRVLFIRGQPISGLNFFLPFHQSLPEGMLPKLLQQNDLVDLDRKDPTPCIQLDASVKYSVIDHKHIQM